MSQRPTATLYTDPGCPFGLSSERERLQLLWHYGHAMEVVTKMIVLNEASKSWHDVPFTAQDIANNGERLRSTYGMPIDTALKADIAATIDACRAYVGAREAKHRRAEALLRAFRWHAISSGDDIADIDVLHRAADEAGVGRDDIDRWLLDDDVETALRADMAEARRPVAEARAMDDKLGGPEGERRYTATSVVFTSGDRTIAAPGFQPWEAWRVGAANVAPEIEPRAKAESVQQIMEWADYPLATAEVAALLQLSIDDARQQLAAAGIEFTAAAQDGYWGAVKVPATA